MWLACVVLVASGDGIEAELRPLLERHCVECHSGEKPKGELDLARFLDGTEVEPGARRETLAAVRAMLAAGEMPPPKKPRPPAELVERALAAIERELGPADERPELRRLNRVEYENAVRDLFGIAYPARELFPAEDVGARFDNDAVGAAASELQVERWVEAAERVAGRALPLAGECETRRYGFQELACEGGAGVQRRSAALYAHGRVSVTHSFPRASRYRLELAGRGDLAGDELPRLVLDLDREELGARELTVEEGEQTLDVTFAAEAGPHELGASFVNDHYAPEHPDPLERDRNAHVFGMTVVGPLDPPPETPFARFLDAELARGGVEGALSALGLRVWRRPLEQDELERLLALAPAAAEPRARLRATLVALLASPNFLYKVERAEARGAQRAFELAARLSFSLWASVPDDELLAAASAGTLARPEELARQVHRLLRDARSRSLVTEFGAQWLGWRALALTTPDRKLFPEADPALLDSMRQESEAFFEAMLREERPLAELLTADFAFLDERLAALYGIEGVRGEGVRRVPLEGSARGGLLGQAALLTVTANATRTAPVKRGKWILETLLGRHVPPPPPGVGVLAEVSGDEPVTLRERLARHRADPDCARCHDQLDPFGFALEGFDPIGRERAGEDVRAELPDGTVLDGVEGLRRYLLASGELEPALARALFAYALGREPDAAERRRLDAGVEALAPERRTLAGLIELVCLQPAFLGPEPR